MACLSAGREWKQDGKGPPCLWKSIGSGFEAQTAAKTNLASCQHAPALHAQCVCFRLQSGKQGFFQLLRQTLGAQDTLKGCCSAYICMEFDDSCEEKPDV